MVRYQLNLKVKDIDYKNIYLKRLDIYGGRYKVR